MEKLKNLKKEHIFSHKTKNKLKKHQNIKNLKKYDFSTFWKSHKMSSFHAFGVSVRAHALPSSLLIALIRTHALPSSKGRRVGRSPSLFQLFCHMLRATHFNLTVHYYLGSRWRQFDLLMFLHVVGHTI